MAFKTKGQKPYVAPQKEQRLVKCPVCGDTLPMKPTPNKAFYDNIPIRHSSWKYDKRRGVRKTWCPGGGI